MVAPAATGARKASTMANKRTPLAHDVGSRMGKRRGSTQNGRCLRRQSSRDRAQCPRRSLPAPRGCRATILRWGANEARLLAIAVRRRGDVGAWCPKEARRFAMFAAFVEKRRRLAGNGGGIRRDCRTRVHDRYETTRGPPATARLVATLARKGRLLVRERRFLTAKRRSSVAHDAIDPSKSRENQRWWVHACYETQDERG
jgi:hypothetical protein